MRKTLIALSLTTVFALTACTAAEEPSTPAEATKYTDYVSLFDALGYEGITEEAASNAVFQTCRMFGERGVTYTMELNAGTPDEQKSEDAALVALATDCPEYRTDYETWAH